MGEGSPLANRTSVKLGYSLVSQIQGLIQCQDRQAPAQAGCDADRNTSQSDDCLGL